MTSKIKLPPRLKTIAGYIENGAVVADVGTDHGLLPVYLAQNKLARRIIASDVSPESLKSAMRTATGSGVTDMIDFVVADGLTGLDEKIIDAVVAAGMGGETIAGILEAAAWTKDPRVRLILQPQSKTSELCRWLRANGYAVRDAELAFDNGRYYAIIIAGGEVCAEFKGHAGSGSEAEGHGTSDRLEPEIELLAVLKKKHDPLFSGYLEEQIRRTHKAVAGMKNSKAPDNTGLKSAYRKLSELIKLRVESH